MKFIANNVITDSSVTITASSANANYPVTNLSHPFRSKMWRSTNSFHITSLNNKINFKDSGVGPEFTATITDGSYTSTTLAAEIKTQMEVLSANTITVTYTAGIWTIATSGAELRLLNNTGTNQATSTLKLVCGFADVDKTGWMTYTAPKIAMHTEEYILIDLKTAESINSMVMLWSIDGGINLTSTATLKLQANATNVWTAPAVNETLTINNTYAVCSHYFTTAQEYRYWRVVISDPQNPNFYVDLGVLILGNAETITSADNGFKYSTQDTSIVTRTAYGNEFVDEYPMISTLTLSFSVLDYDDATILEEAYKSNGVRKPVYVALDDTNTVFDKDHFSIYGKMQQNLEIGQVNYDIFNTELTILEIT